jgi:hypothetical protein
MGMYWRKRQRKMAKTTPADRNAILVTLFIYALWVAEFFYEGGVPLFKILFGVPYAYELFGIPSLHVFIVTFSSFYTIYLFHLYLSTKKRLLLLLFLLNLMAAVLIYSRAMLMFNLCASVFLFLHLNPSLVKKLFPYAPVVIILFLFGFGIIGNQRVSHGNNKSYDNTIFLGTGRATEEFKSSAIPKEFFWTYIYTSSSLANLQENINHADRHGPSLHWLLKMVNNEMLPDFISKRINKWFKIPHPGEYRIERYFNVSTVYSISFSHQSWTGMVIMLFYLIAFPVIYLKILGTSGPYQLVGIAILSTMYLFMAYDNTIRFTGLSFQLVYPVILGWLEKKNWFSLRKLKVIK